MSTKYGMEDKLITICPKKNQTCWNMLGMGFLPWLSRWSVKHKHCRGSSDLASCKVSLNSGQPFQRKSWKWYEFTTTDGRTDYGQHLITIVHLSLPQRFTKIDINSIIFEHFVSILVRALYLYSNMVDYILEITLQVLDFCLAFFYYIFNDLLFSYRVVISFLLEKLDRHWDKMLLSIDKKECYLRRYLNK